MWIIHHPQSIQMAAVLSAFIWVTQVRDFKDIYRKVREAVTRIF